MSRRDRATLVGAELSIFGLTALGWLLSFNGLKSSAEAHGYQGWEAWLWPLTPDLLALAATLLAMMMARRGHGPTGEAWLMAGLAAVVSLAGNVIPFLGDPIAMAFHAWPALCMVGAWHLFFRSTEVEERPPAASWRPVRRGADAGADPAPNLAPAERRRPAIEARSSAPASGMAGAAPTSARTAEASPSDASTDANDGVVLALQVAPPRRRAAAAGRRREDRRLVRMARLLERARERGEEPTNGELAKALNTSETTARRLRSRIQQAAAPAAAEEA